MINFELLKTISEIPGAPGREEKVRAFVEKELASYADEMTTDNMGNLTVFIKGKTPKKVMVAAHMDEIGFIVTHIDDNGFLKFHTLGGFDPKTLTAQRVIVHGKKDLVGVMGSKPIHIMSPDERGKNVKTTDFFIDLGLPKEEVEKYIEVGNSITRERQLIEMGDCVNGKSLDNRASVYALVEAVKTVKNPAYDFYAVFTTQEEVGLRGAQAAAIAIKPDFGIALDTTIAFDVPGAGAHEHVTDLGKGAAIKIMDAGTICDYRMVEFLKTMAAEFDIPWQPEILTAGGTDTAAMQRMSAGGAIAGAISIPTRHIHQVIETVHKEDLKHCISLLVKAIENIDSIKL